MLQIIASFFGFLVVCSVGCVRCVFANVPFAKDISDAAWSWGVRLHARVMSRRLAPDRSNWVCVATVKREPPLCGESIVPRFYARDRWVFHETYLETYSSRETMEVANAVLETAPPGALVIARLDGTEVYREKGSRAPIRAPSASPNAPAKFLVITYNHPWMRAPVFVELPRAAYAAGNTVLGAVWLARWLAHNVGGEGTRYVIDDGYTVEVMDTALRRATLRTGDAAEMTQTGYVIVKQT